MYNELLFAAHVAVVSVSVLGGLLHSYGALLAVLSLQLILANFFVTKQMILFGMVSTCSEVFTVSAMFGVSLIQQYYGTKRAQQTIVYTFLSLILFVVLTQLHNWYLPLDGNQISLAFNKLLSTAPRMLFASMVAYVVSERVNVYCARMLDSRGDSLLARVAAIGVGQLCDTVVFAFIGLYGLVSSLTSIIVVSMLVKTVVIISLSPLLAIAQRLVNRLGGIGE